MPIYRQSLDSFYGSLLGLDNLPLPGPIYRMLLPSLLGAFKQYSFTIAVSSEPKLCRLAEKVPVDAPPVPKEPKEGGTGDGTPKAAQPQPTPMCYALIDSPPRSPHLSDPITMKLKANGNVASWVTLSFDLDVTTTFSLSNIDVLKSCNLTCENSDWHVNVEATCQGSVTVSGSINPGTGGTGGKLLGLDIPANGSISGTVPVWHQETFSYDCTPTAITPLPTAGTGGTTGGGGPTGGSVPGTSSAAGGGVALTPPKPKLYTGTGDCNVQIKISTIRTSSPSLYDVAVEFDFSIDSERPMPIRGHFNKLGVYQPDDPSLYDLFHETIRGACRADVSLDVGVVVAVGYDGPLPPTFGGGQLTVGPQHCSDATTLPRFYTLIARQGAIREITIDLAVMMTCSGR